MVKTSEEGSWEPIFDYFPSPLETESPILTQPPNSCSKERGNESMVDKKHYLLARYQPMC
ncbi:hypothetical protein Hanom_Chr09g00836121 [Helianthus anomalus]